MIVDLQKNWGCYAPLCPELEQAVGFIAACTQETANGRYPIDGERVYALVSEQETSESDDSAWESHRRYLDLHVLLSGNEAIRWADASTLSVAAPYNEEKDCCLYGGRAEESVVLNPGNFALFFPRDAHKVRCAAQAPGPIKKVVVKILLEAQPDSLAFDDESVTEE